MDSNNPAPAGNQKQLTPKRKILIYGSIFLVTFVIVFAIGFFFLRKPANNEKLEVSDITMTVADEHGDPIRGRHFEFRFDDIVLPIKRYSHGTGQPLGGGCQKDIFYHAPDGGKGVQFGNVFAV